LPLDDDRVDHELEALLTRDPTAGAIAALHRLLRDAARGGQAKVDAIRAVMQRTVFVVPWPAGNEGFRTLVNREGLVALPMFTDRSQLEIAARRYGWLAPDGSVPAIEVGAREAFHYARAKNISYVVVDIAADHCVEIEQDEFEPLLVTDARKTSTRSLSSTKKAESTRGGAGDAVHPASPTREPTIRVPTPPPGSLAVARQQATGPDHGSAAPAGDVSTVGAPCGASTSPMQTSTPPAAVQGTVLPGMRLGRLATPPEDALLDRLEDVLRGYPEVEWACIGSGSQGVPALGLRVDPRVRHRVDEIAARVATVAAPRALPVVLLDDPQQMRAARTDAWVFYPWRRR
jgi:hypothetical protein